MNKNSYSIDWLKKRLEIVNLVLDLYYIEHLTQQQISNKLFISQCKVSLILKNNKMNKED